jgi:glutathione S-transferase
MTQYVLLDRRVSGNCWRVRLLAGLLGVSIDRIEVDILAGESRTDLFRRLNPREQVPVLVVYDDGRKPPLVIRDSLAILVWLAARFDTGWLGRGAEERASEAEWFALAAAEHQLGIRAARAALVFGLRPAGFSIDRAQTLGRRSLAMMDQRLRSFRWLVANRPTIADVACFPYASLATEAGIAIDGYPSLIRWLEDVAALDGFRGLDDRTGSAGVSWHGATERLAAILGED